VNALPGIDEALDQVLARVRPAPVEEVAIAAAAGRVLAQEARAAVDLPPFDSSAMDGYAVRASDTPGRLPIGGQSAAGSPLGRTLHSGEAVVISTGAVVPEGADAVVPVERSERDGDVVQLEQVAAGAHVRPRGGDARSGETIGAAGQVLGPTQVGALAAVGLATVVCARRPRVAVLATGSELRAPGESLGPGEIYESNTTLIAAQVTSAGGEPVVLAPVADDAAATREALERGLESDVLITSGGVSVGPHDLVRRALQELGAVEVFWRVAVKPGKPIAFATCGESLVFGLPGNPVSSLVGFELFVRPALLALQGAARPQPAFLPGRAAADLPRNDERDELVRARVRVEPEGVVLEPLTGQDSHMIARAFPAEALVLVPRGDGIVPAGAPVSYLSL
jgi:molybdopterin molybdotransferase